MTIKDCDLELGEDKHQPTPTDTLLFPCTAYFTDIKNKFAGELPWHWHEEIEVLIVKKGSVIFSFPDKSIVLNEGQGCFINSNVLHTAHTGMDCDCILHSLLFLPSLISGPVESIFNQRYVKPLIKADHIPFIIFENDIGWQGDALEMLENAYSTYGANDFGFEWGVRESLSKIWHLIIKNYETLLSQPPAEQDITLSRVKTMLAFIHSNYQRSISLAEIANAASVSDRECLRCFQKSIGISPMQYLIQYRLNVATKHLLETDLDITMICQEVGIESPSYFSKKFKESRGITPSECRKRKI